MRHLVVRLVFVIALQVMVAGVPRLPAAAATEPEIIWQLCPSAELPTQECGTLEVPLDYDEPEGTTISLAVARVPATDDAHRIGSLITNPGGPGGSGVEAMPLLYAALPQALKTRFDLVGFDPRGIGQSAPVHCFDTVAERTAFFAAIPSVPIGADEGTARQRAVEDLARRCGERNGEILPHLSTANVARDMDQLRQAVGDEQLTYLGSSYGTYLGATYANLFPNQLRAMVLDGVIDPPSYANADQSVGNAVGPDTNSFLRITSDRGSAGARDQFLADCAAAGPDNCAFAAASAAETRKKFDVLMARVLAEPVVAQGPAGTLTVTYSLVVDTVRGALYAAPFWSGLAEGLQRLEEGDAVGFLEATHSLGGPPPTEYHNTQEATPASNCVDADNPRESEQFQEMVRGADERTPYFGAVWAYLVEPCLYWPAQDDDRYVGPWNVPTSATILLISRLYDPATPHSSAIAASKSLANARLLTIDGWGHSFFEGGLSTCANDAMARYLIDVELPAEGTVCPEDASPFAEPLEEAVETATPVPINDVTV